MKRSNIAVSRDRTRMDGEVDNVSPTSAPYAGWELCGKGSDEALRGRCARYEPTKCVRRIDVETVVKALDRR